MSKDDATPPPFLTKTFEMVDDPATDSIVSWSGDDSFVVKDPGEFSTNILPCYFKHNNLSSFVRQLNIYGFRKVNSDCWEFAHPNFRRGWFGLLKDIKRRKTATREPPLKMESPPDMPGMLESAAVAAAAAAAAVAASGDHLHHDHPFQHTHPGALPRTNADNLLGEVLRLRKQQDATQRMLAATLNELHETRCEQQRTQDIVEKIVSFLASIVETNHGAPLVEFMDQTFDEVRARKRRRPNLFNMQVGMQMASSGASAFHPGGESLIVKPQPTHGVPPPIPVSTGAFQVQDQPLANLLKAKTLSPLKPNEAQAVEWQQLLKQADGLKNGHNGSAQMYSPSQNGGAHGL